MVSPRFKLGNYSFQTSHIFWESTDLKFCKLAKRVKNAKVSQQPFLRLSSFKHHFYTFWARNSWLVPDSSWGNNLFRPHIFFWKIDWLEVIIYCKLAKRVQNAKVSQQPFLGLSSFKHHFYTFWSRNSRLVPDSSWGKNCSKPHIYLKILIDFDWNTMLNM